MMSIWIIAHSVDSAAALIAGAKSVTPDAVITAFVQANEEDAKAVYDYGVTQVFALPLNNASLWENDYLPALTAQARKDKPRLVLFTTARRCRDLAARLAAMLDAPCLSGARQLKLAGETLSAVTMMYGGLAVKSVSTSAPTVLAIIDPQNYEAGIPVAGAGGDVARLAVAQSDARIIDRQPRLAQSVDLSQAQRVVGVGRGLSDVSELAIAEGLAKKLGAEMACSRPIAEFFHWLPEDRYLGISGQVIKPQLYVAIGISGQAQHYYGVRDAATIVSINKDEQALMNQNADYYLVGDFREIVPALITALS